MKKNEIRLAFSDFPGSTNIDYLTDLLSSRFEVVIDQDRPDFLIYSVFGNRFLDYKNVIRICFIAENVRPNFNLCDYAFSYDWLDFGDRHFRAPNFVIYPQWQDLLARRSSSVVDIAKKPDFCNFIYTNAEGHPNRIQFFYALNAIKRVTSFGRLMPNSERTIDAPYSGDWSASKVAAQRSFRFSIAFENSPSPGYTTEKIVHALAADTIPIYWGDPLVSRIFNPERFIDVRQLGFEKSIERIMELDENPQAFLKTINKPFFSEGSPLSSLTTEALLDAFSRIFCRSKDDALRRETYLWGPKYEAQLRTVSDVAQRSRLFDLIRKKFGV